MTFEKTTEVANMVLSINWDAVFGILIALVFLRKGSRLLMSTPDNYETDAKMQEFLRWRPWVLGLLFIILGTWAAGGASNLGGQFWHIVDQTIILGMLYLGFRYVRDMWKAWPLRGQRFEVQGIGPVIVQHADGIAVKYTYTSDHYNETVEDVVFVPLFLLRAKLIVEENKL